MLSLIRRIVSVFWVIFFCLVSMPFVCVFPSCPGASCGNFQRSCGILARSWRDPGEILGRSSGGDLRGCSCWGCDRDPIRILLTFQDFEILQDRFSGSLVSFHHFCLQGTFLRDLVFRIIFDTFLFSESFFNGIQFSGSDEDRFQIAVLSGNHST